MNFNKPPVNEDYRLALSVESEQLRALVVGPEQVSEDVDIFLKYFVGISKLDGKKFSDRGSFTEDFRNYVKENVSGSRYEMWKYDEAINSRCNEAGIIGEVVDNDR